MVQIDHLSADIGSLGLCYFCNITDLILKFAIKSLLNWSPGRFPIRSGMTVGAIRMSLHELILLMSQNSTGRNGRFHEGKTS